ncbi:hypothetical protein [Yoonia sp.]|uniref:hypothetical protein n=1 Tax=Yoonia sp. TaxID=2212373 RepID=UPI003974F7E0
MTDRAFSSFLAIAVAMNLGATTALDAADVAEPVDDVAAQPLGPPMVSFPITAAESHGAFPVEILMQMRAALVARAPKPESPVVEMDDDD